jgi:hypothetical protein
MKIKRAFILFILASYTASGQGFVNIDQQSTNIIEGGAALNVIGQPMGQSFTPALSSLNFVLLNLYDAGSLEAVGATVVVNIRTSSITGAILGSSMPVFMPNAFFGVTNFMFSIPVTLVSGSVYYLEPVAQAGSDGWGSYVTDGSYSGGSLIQSGIPVIGRNLWFQEGVIGTPEPSSLALLVLGCSFLASFRKRKIRNEN